MRAAGARSSKLRKEKKGVSRLGSKSHIQGRRKEEESEKNKNIPFKVVVPAGAHQKSATTVKHPSFRSPSILVARVIYELG
ncbi:hypothetical protein ACLB2K_055983 [Fragaria x ananassa]